MTTIYLDYAATTPMHPKVIDKYTETMKQLVGNPSSIHHLGRDARKWLDIARKEIAASIHAKQHEVIFTSGGTEADNMAIFGTVAAYKHLGNHIITTAIEHHAVLRACEQLEREGMRVTYLKPDCEGQITAEQVREQLTEETILVSIMFGNNEVGTLQPIAEIGHILQSHQAVFHTDAVQAYGVLPIHVDELGVDLLSTSSHKLNGPKGIGFLYERTGINIQPTSFGGDQERKRRAGTENVPAIIAFAEAVTIAEDVLKENVERYKSFKKRMIAEFAKAQIMYKVHGENAEVMPHILNVSFAGTDIESLLVNLDMAGVFVSSGSACTAGSLEPSHVLTAMFGEGAAELRNSVRFSFGYGLEEEDIIKAAQKTVEIVKRLAQ